MCIEDKDVACTLAGCKALPPNLDHTMAQTLAIALINAEAYHGPCRYYTMQPGAHQVTMQQMVAAVLVQHLPGYGHQLVKSAFGAPCAKPTCHKVSANLP